MNSDFTDRITALLTKVDDSFRQLLDTRQLTAGASQETYCISVETTGGERKYALRRSRANAATEGVGNISLATEAKLFQLASANGIPGPEVLYVLSPEDELGAGFLMEWLEGETLGKRINTSDQYAGLRKGLAHECGQILGRIHSIDWQAAGVQLDLPTLTPSALVADTFETYVQLGVPVPMIDYTQRWLMENLPENNRQTLVHGDFRNGNLMVTPDGVNAVLDWELAQIGDPIRDLGWICVNSWRFGMSELAVGGFGETEDLLAGYSKTANVEVSLEELKFWQVFGSFWWAITTLVMANAWRTGEAPSLERPVIGRRSSEAQMDCVNLLIPGAYTLPNASQLLSEGTQLPMAAELLESVALFLTDEVAGALDPKSNYLANVASSSVRIAQRELLHGPTADIEEQARLESLLGKVGELDELRGELVGELRNGLKLDTPSLQEHLRQSVALQLAIDQPNYSALNNMK